MPSCTGISAVCSCSTSWGTPTPQEVIYCGLYCFAYLRKLLENIIATPNLFAIFSYDYLIWARSNFIRFCIPVLPFVFFALLRVLPKNRWVLWGLCVVSAVLAAASAVGVRNAIATVP